MKEKSKVASEDAQPQSYREAVDELEEILSEIESGDADVDMLSIKVKRALFLVGFCRGVGRCPGHCLRCRRPRLEPDHRSS